MAWLQHVSFWVPAGQPLAHKCAPWRYAPCMFSQQAHVLGSTCMLGGLQSGKGAKIRNSERGFEQGRAWAAHAGPSTPAQSVPAMPHGSRARRRAGRHVRAAAEQLWRSLGGQESAAAATGRADHQRRGHHAGGRALRAERLHRRRAHQRAVHALVVLGRAGAVRRRRLHPNFLRGRPWPPVMRGNGGSRVLAMLAPRACHRERRPVMPGRRRSARARAFQFFAALFAGLL